MRTLSPRPPVNQQVQDNNRPSYKFRVTEIDVVGHSLAQRGLLLIRGHTLQKALCIELYCTHKHVSTNVV